MRINKVMKEGCHDNRYTKFMLPWQPFQDVLTYFLVNILNLTIIIYSNQGFMNIWKMSF